MTKYLTLVKIDEVKDGFDYDPLSVTRCLLLCPHYFVFKLEESFYSSSSTKLLYAKDNAIKMFSDKISLICCRPYF